MRFHTSLLQSDETATGIVVPDEVVEALARLRRIAKSVEMLKEGRAR